MISEVFIKNQINIDHIQDRSLKYHYNGNNTGLNSLFLNPNLYYSLRNY